ncbi:MAG: c-type cytochrome [Gammaproteobacteria bacterium]|nr:c-type cytochrome [Gammaproteobacteria bacterium]
MRILVAALLLSGIPMGAYADGEEGIADRIRKAGNVCIRGIECVQTATPLESVGEDTGDQTATAMESVEEDIGDQTAVVEPVSQGMDLVKENYAKTCGICHDAGVANAPKFGDAEQWASRIIKGKDRLYMSSIIGMPPAMPARGMCFSCSDDDLKALVDYMVEAATVTP